MALKHRLRDPDGASSHDPNWILGSDGLQVGDVGDGRSSRDIGQHAIEIKQDGLGRDGREGGVLDSNSVRGGDMEGLPLDVGAVTERDEDGAQPIEVRVAQLQLAIRRSRQLHTGSAKEIAH